MSNLGSIPFTNTINESMNANRDLYNHYVHDSCALCTGTLVLY